MRLQESLQKYLPNKISSRFHSDLKFKRKMKIQN